MMMMMTSRYHGLGIVNSRGLVGFQLLYFSFRDPFQHQRLFVHEVPGFVECLSIDPDLVEIGYCFGTSIVEHPVALLADGPQVHGVFDDIGVGRPDSEGLSVNGLPKEKEVMGRFW